MTKVFSCGSYVQDVSLTSILGTGIPSSLSAVNYSSNYLGFGTLDASGDTSFFNRVTSTDLNAQGEYRPGAGGAAESFSSTTSGIDASIQYLQAPYIYNHFNETADTTRTNFGFYFYTPGVPVNTTYLKFYQTGYTGGRITFT